MWPISVLHSPHLLGLHALLETLTGLSEIYCCPSDPGPQGVWAGHLFAVCNVISGVVPSLGCSPYLPQGRGPVLLQTHCCNLWPFASTGAGLRSPLRGTPSWVLRGSQPHAHLQGTLSLFGMKQPAGPEGLASVSLFSKSCIICTLISRPCRKTRSRLSLQVPSLGCLLS